MKYRVSERDVTQAPPRDWPQILAELIDYCDRDKLPGWMPRPRYLDLELPSVKLFDENFKLNRDAWDLLEPVPQIHFDLSTFVLDD